MARRLTSGELLLLQLRAKGYSVAQIAAVTHRPEREVVAALAAALEALGAQDERGALAASRRRGLIDG